MQEYEPGFPSELMKTLLGQRDELQSLGESMVKRGEASRFVIGELPEEGSDVEINGLKFYVFSRTEGGTVVLKLKKIK